MKLKWISYLINTIASLLIALSLLVLLNVVMTPSGQVPQVMGFSVLRVLTGSMEPEIPEHSMLLVRRVDPETLAAEDVITFFSPDPALNGVPVTHRILRLESSEGERHFVTKGDANVLEDPHPVAPSQVVGKVIFVSPLLGRLVTEISTPLVFGLLIVLPLAIMLVCSVVNALRSAARLARQEEEQAVRQALEEIKARKANENGKE